MLSIQRDVSTIQTKPVDHYLSSNHEQIDLAQTFIGCRIHNLTSQDDVFTAIQIQEHGLAAQACNKKHKRMTDRT